MFADTNVELQRLINRLKEYCDRSALKINIAKTRVVYFKMVGTSENTRNGFMIIFLYELFHIINI